jgi:tyrosinase
VNPAKNYVAYPFNFFGDIPYTNITIDYEMDFYELVPGQQTVKVADVMNIQSGLLCYGYA